MSSTFGLAGTFSCHVSFSTMKSLFALYRSASGCFSMRSTHADLMQRQPLLLIRGAYTINWGITWTIKHTGCKLVECYNISRATCFAKLTRLTYTNRCSMHTIKVPMCGVPKAVLGFSWPWFQKKRPFQPCIRWKAHTLCKSYLWNAFSTFSGLLYVNTIKVSPPGRLVNCFCKII